MKRRLVRCGALAALSMVFARAALAQHVEGRIGAQHVTFVLNDAGVTRSQSGTMLGGSLELTLGVLQLGIGGATGQLAAVDTGLVARDLRMTAISAGIQANPWLLIGARAVARREAVDTTIILHRLGGAFVHVTPAFGEGGLGGLFDFAYYPINSVSGVDQPKLALGAAIGVRYAPVTSPVLVQLSYRLFRIDHQALTTSVPRLEQDQGLILELGLRH